MEKEKRHGDLNGGLEQEVIKLRADAFYTFMDTQDAKENLNLRINIVPQPKEIDKTFDE